MPPKFGGGDKCALCDKTVFAQEKMAAGGKSFHKTCFKCSVCKQSLKLENYAQAEGVLYCKTHYQQNVVAKNTQVAGTH